jgi:hypothetical protein
MEEEEKEEDRLLKYVVSKSECVVSNGVIKRGQLIREVGKRRFLA